MGAPGTTMLEGDMFDGQKEVRSALVLAGQGHLHDSSISLMRMITVAGIAQSALDGTVLPGYNQTRMEEFDRACSALDPDYRAAAEERAIEKKKDTKLSPGVPVPPEKVKSFLQERDRIEKQVLERGTITAEEFLRT